jgi:hypothetical protein
VPVHILRGPEAARRWTESHYDGVDWESPHRAAALVGRLTSPAQTPSLPLASDGGEWERDRLTYETAELRAYLPALVASEDSLVIVQRCEERVSELDRWEPFVNVLWRSIAGPPAASS